MPDLLTHVLVAYAVLTVASWRLDFDRRFVPIGIAGTIVPDLAKVHLLLDTDTVEQLLGLPFSWQPLHRLGGAVLLCGIAATFVRSSERSRALAFLLAGTGLHFALDAGVIRANGVIPPYFYPVSWYQPPAANLYLSSDVWPLLVAVPIAGGVWLVDRYVIDTDDGSIDSPN